MIGMVVVYFIIDSDTNFFSQLYKFLILTKYLKITLFNLNILGINHVKSKNETKRSKCQFQRII